MIESVPQPVKESTWPLEDGTRLRAGPAASWGAIFAGAAVAVATSLILLTLGAGLGFAALSPWPGQGVAGSTFTITGAIWLIVTQWLSAAMGGYITGRLRHRWLATHTHEVFFRDTAHGLVTWAVATIAVAAVAAGSLSSIAGGATRSMSPITGAEIRGSADGTSGNARAGNATAGSAAIPQDEEQKRADMFNAEANDAQLRLKVAADDARKAAAETAIFTALAMLIGAFIASVAAAIGGHLRDEHL
jgi:hypothetical protein